MIRFTLLSVKGLINKLVKCSTNSLNGLPTALAITLGGVTLKLYPYGLSPGKVCVELGDRSRTNVRTSNKFGGDRSRAWVRKSTVYTYRTRAEHKKYAMKRTDTVNTVNTPLIRHLPFDP